MEYRSDEEHHRSEEAQLKALSTEELGILRCCLPANYRFTPQVVQPS
jgi:hypothetical protein